MTDKTVIWAIDSSDQRYVRVEDYEALKTQRDALREAIRDHNAVLQDACGHGEQEAVRCQYRPYFVANGRRCPDCPTYCMIDIDAAIDAAKGKP